MAEGRPERDAGVSGRGVLIGVGLIACAIVMTLIVGWALLHAWEPRANAGTATRPASPLQSATGPKLQADPVRDIAAYRAQKQKLLTTYAWVDREHGIVRIPIERAMQAIASGAAGAGDR